MWRKKAAPVGGSKLEARVQRLSEADLIAWSDQALYATGRNLTAWHRDGLGEYLEEAQQGAEALLAIVREISRRANW